MARKSPSEHVFSLTLPLTCEKWQRDRLDTLFRVCNEIKNHLIAYELKQYKNLTARRDWKAIQAEFSTAYTNKDKEGVSSAGEKRTALLKATGFTENDFQKQVKRYREHYKGPGGKECLVHSQIAQKIADSVWDKFESMIYGNGKEVHFSRWTEFTTISGKQNSTGIKYLDGTVTVCSMSIPVILDKKDPYRYQREALQRTIRFCSIVRRWYASGWKYFVQITLDGTPPVKVKPSTGELLHPLGIGRVGHDIGTQTIASCGSDNVILAELADQVHGIDAELRRINRAMDRSRRSNNPDMFYEDGTVIPKNKLSKEHLTERDERIWIKSKRYLRLEARRRELYRRQRELRRQQHNELANKILAFGDQHFIEEMRFRTLAKRTKETKKTKTGKYKSKKRFGKSISNKAPASFVRILKQKVVAAGGSFENINTFTVKASQLNHITETYTKKSLGKRWDKIDGKEVQRDLYSAFLIMNVNETLDHEDFDRARQTYPQFLKLHDDEIERISHLMMPSSTGVKHTA